MKNVLIIILAVVCVILLGTIMFGKDKESTQTAVNDKPFAGVTVRLAKQYGMQYATGYIVEKMNLLEKYLPGATIEWSSFGGGAAITEALISGHLDVGFMGMPPAVIAIDKGADLKIASGVCVPPFDLMVKEERLKSIADFTPQDKIAIPGISSTQHILLSIAAKDKLNKAGFNTGNSQSGIVPIIIGDEPTLFKMHEDLRLSGVYTNVITYPAVRRKDCRIRLCIMKDLTHAQIDKAVEIITKIGKKYGVI